jgi:hypothetical protein
MSVRVELRERHDSDLIEADVPAHGPSAVVPLSALSLPDRYRLTLARSSGQGGRVQLAEHAELDLVRE